VRSPCRARRVRRRPLLWIFNHYAVSRDASYMTRHFDFARELVAHGYDVTIFAASVNHLSQKDRLHGHEFFRVETVDRVRFVWIRTPSYAGNSPARILNMMVYSVGALIYQARENTPDYVIGSSPHPFAAAAGLLAAGLRGRPFFFEIRDLWPQTLIDTGEMSPKSTIVKVLRLLERVLYDASATVVSLLEGVPDYARANGLDPSKVVHIPNGVVLSDRSVVPDSRQMAMLRKFRSSHSFLAMYVGAFGLANGVSVIADAAELLLKRGRTDIGIVLIGDGPDRERLATKIAQLHLHNVRLLDPVPKVEVPAYLAAADAGILHFRRSAVHRYGISFNKLYDYMASSLPILYACATEHDPVESIGAGLSALPDSPSAMADALVQLADSTPTVRSDMAERGYRYVAQHHSVSMLAERLSGVLREASERKDLGAPQDRASDTSDTDNTRSRDARRR
jgi:glycosyltransferase involved in cell wall biosynthesis